MPCATGKFGGPRPRCSASRRSREGPAASRGSCGAVAVSVLARPGGEAGTTPPLATRSVLKRGRGGAAEGPSAAAAEIVVAVRAASAVGSAVVPVNASPAVLVRPPVTEPAASKRTSPDRDSQYWREDVGAAWLVRPPPLASPALALAATARATVRHSSDPVACLPVRSRAGLDTCRAGQQSAAPAATAQPAYVLWDELAFEALKQWRPDHSNQPKGHSY
eukprot:2519835-Pleurochrysis_carterae.AAC.6